MLGIGGEHVAKVITENTLFYGDNLEILRDYLIDECVDLIYLDPPFNSNRNYNVLFKDEQGLDSEAQIVAFEDTWHWGPETEHAYHRLITYGPDKVASMMTALRGFIGTNQMMAYLTMMTARLVELHRVQEAFIFTVIQRPATTSRLFSIRSLAHKTFAMRLVGGERERIVMERRGEKD